MIGSASAKYFEVRVIMHVRMSCLLAIGTNDFGFDFYMHRVFYSF
jgi:hypothetical protein